jgi:hypothetical protein
MDLHPDHQFPIALRARDDLGFRGLITDVKHGVPSCDPFARLSMASGQRHQARCRGFGTNGRAERGHPGPTVARLSAFGSRVRTSKIGKSTMNRNNSQARTNTSTVIDEAKKRDMAVSHQFQGYVVLRINLSG